MILSNVKYYRQQWKCFHNINSCSSYIRWIVEHWNMSTNKLYGQSTIEQQHVYFKNTFMKVGLWKLVMKVLDKKRVDKCLSAFCLPPVLFSLLARVLVHMRKTMLSIHDWIISHHMRKRMLSIHDWIISHHEKNYAKCTWFDYISPYEKNYAKYTCLDYMCPNLHIKLFSLKARVRIPP